MKTVELIDFLKLERDLAFFDIEATGINTRADRIIELAIVKVTPSGETPTNVFRVNPGMPIPAEATAVHGITDRDVADCPPFARIAPEVFALLADCDLAGYNLLRYDIPLLTEEFARCGIAFTVEGRRIIDAQRIFHLREPRDLTAALAFYRGAFHDGAHGAEADALATLRVLEGQFRRYSDLPRNIDKLSDYCDLRDVSWVDAQGRLRWVDGLVTINFGKNKGTPLATIIANDSSFVNWLLRSDFPEDTKRIVEQARQGRWPTPPVAADPA